MITILGDVFSMKNSKIIYTNRKTGKPFVGKNKVVQEKMDNVIRQLLSKENIDSWKSMTKGKMHPYRIAFRIFRGTERKWDYVNVVQGILDAMVACAYIPDDSYEYVIPEFYSTQLDRINPRTEITVL